MGRFAIFSMSLGLVGCTVAGGPSAPGEPPPPPPVVAASYPLSFPVLDENELARRTKLVQQRSPEWQVTLDQFGFLSRAVCKEACGHDGHGKGFGSTPLSQLDRDQIGIFLEKNEDIVQLKAPGSTKKNAGFYQQVGPSGVMARVRMDADAHGARISGHFWPVLPAAGATKSSADLERILKGLDPTPDIGVERGYRCTAKSVSGPLQIHEVACARLLADDDITDRDARPHRPCVDARTGEELTKDLVGWTIRTVDGTVVERRLTNH